MLICQHAERCSLDVNYSDKWNMEELCKKRAYRKVGGGGGPVNGMFLGNMRETLG